MKAKTKSAAKKRIQIKKSGAIKMNKVGKRHLLTKKSKKRKLQGRTHASPASVDKKMISKIMPGTKRARKSTVKTEEITA